MLNLNSDTVFSAQWSEFPESTAGTLSHQQEHCSCPSCLWELNIQFTSLAHKIPPCSIFLPTSNLHSPLWLRAMECGYIAQQALLRPACLVSAVCEWVWATWQLTVDLLLAERVSIPSCTLFIHGISVCAGRCCIDGYFSFWILGCRLKKKG